MTNYIKVCPTCGQKNAESVYVCQGSTCNGYFLGDVEPVLDSEDFGASDTTACVNEEPHHGNDDSSSQENCQEETPHTQGRPKTTRFSPQPMLCLEYLGKVHNIESGTVMGRADATSTATLQIPGLPSYIHRHHCRFDFQKGHWQVTAIKNDDTNATYVNANEILPNQFAPIKNGDRLTLCDITFQVRILL